MCQARREGDMMCCGKCGLQWDVVDDDPPQCKRDEPVPEVEHADRVAYLRFIKEKGLLK